MMAVPRRQFVIFFIVLCRLTVCLARKAEAEADLNVYLSPIDIIKKYDYPVEKHPVTTEDGYILELHRIPFSAKSGGSPNKTSVLLVHGLFRSSVDWITLGPKKSLGFVLADLGYDVWLVNSRGNTFSRNHSVLDPNISKQYWDFSWHEMGVYDIPAAIDYILVLTRQQKLFYIGHSQGTTQFYVMASERPEYNDKIRAMFSLAPVAFMSHAKHPLMRLADAFRSTSVITALIGTQIREFLPHSDAIPNMSAKYCTVGNPTQFFCKLYWGVQFGFDLEQLNETTLPLLIAYSAEGVSTKQLFHYTQIAVSGKFRRYDYGRTENLKRYGRPTPPDYDLSKMTAPIALHCAQNDFLSESVDVDKLYNQLVEPIGKFLVPNQKFNHMDFLFAKDVQILLYDKLIALMEIY